MSRSSFRYIIASLKYLVIWMCSVPAFTLVKVLENRRHRTVTIIALMTIKVRISTTVKALIPLKRGFKKREFDPAGFGI